MKLPLLGFRGLTGWIGFTLPILIQPGASAQSPFNGTWKVDLSESQSSRTPDVYELHAGIYRCSTCDPPVEVKADGRDYPFTGDPCYDTISVSVLNDRTVLETEKRNGKTVGTSRMTVAADGHSATMEWTESCNANGDVVSGKDLLTRVTSGSSGSHAISGSWVISKRVNRSENALVITTKIEGDTFSFLDPAGQGYTAKLDGTEAPIHGDLSGTTVSVKRVAQNVIEETDKRSGITKTINRFEISPDGKVMTVTITDVATGSSRKYVLHKQ